MSPHLEKVSQDDNEGRRQCAVEPHSFQEEVDVRYTQASLIVACVYLNVNALCTFRVSVPPGRCHTWVFGLHPAWDLLLLVLTHSVAFQCMHEQMVVVGVWWVFNLIKSDPRTAIKRIQ